MLIYEIGRFNLSKLYNIFRWNFCLDEKYFKVYENSI